MAMIGDPRSLDVCRWIAGFVLTAGLLGGCVGWSQTPYNARQACDIVGGRYTADGRCLAGNS